MQGNSYIALSSFSFQAALSLFGFAERCESCSARLFWDDWPGDGRCWLLGELRDCFGLLGGERAKADLLGVMAEGDEDGPGLEAGPGLTSGLERGGVGMPGLGLIVPDVDGAVGAMRGTDCDVGRDLRCSGAPGVRLGA